MRADIPTDTPTPFLILKHTVLLPTLPDHLLPQFYHFRKTFKQVIKRPLKGILPHLRRRPYPMPDKRTSKYTRQKAPFYTVLACL